ncbi:MAG: hypothetical protein ACI86M_003786 [Saprospiraceae bacterium]|jgi:hypothetical protein
MNTKLRNEGPIPNLSEGVANGKKLASAIQTSNQNKLPSSKKVVVYFEFL